MTQTPFVAQPGGTAPRIDYLPAAASRSDLLFTVRFGAAGAATAGSVSLPFRALAGQDLVEAWFATGPVIRGESGAIRHSEDGNFLAGVLEIDEASRGGIVGAAETAYRAIAQFQRASNYPHLLRTWNYFDAINEGEGDAERYRGFCTGRVAGLLHGPQSQHPAATVIGHHDDRRILQVYWLAGRQPGVALDNPRQVSPWRYPREYGETSPTFSRAMLVTPTLLMVSGTASIVGHASQHPGDARLQVREILANLSALLERAHAQSPALPATFGAGTRLKAYVRNAGDAEFVEQELRALLPAGVPLLLLQGDVCRSDLLVEFDCQHAA